MFFRAIIFSVFICALAAPAMAQNPALNKQSPLPSAMPSVPGRQEAPAPQQQASPQPEAAPRARTIEVQIDEQMKQSDVAYQAALQKLTKQQQDYLVYLDQEFINVMTPDINILDMGFQLEYCLTADPVMSKAQAKYKTAYNNWRARQNAQQDDLKRQHGKLRDKAAYIDRKVLDLHFVASAKLQLMIAAAVMKAGKDQGGYAKTDCGQVRKILGG